MMLIAFGLLIVLAILMIAFWLIGPGDED